MADKLFFYSKSADKPPGKGVHETVQDYSVYTELAKIKDWRKVLSNFHYHPFKFNGYTFNTIEHAFHWAKISIADPQRALEFTVESNTELGLGDGEMARKNRKLMVLTKSQLKMWSEQHHALMEDAARAKYAQCDESRMVLQSTGNAQLWHVVGRSSVHAHFIHLEKIRHELSQP
jgi:ribA/ribD-fused uncharacterized protein